jgi:hypothetical protein
VALLKTAASGLRALGRVRFRRPWLARLLLYGGALFLGLPWAFSSVLLRTFRQPTSAPPRGYEQLQLTVDGLKLRAWLDRSPGPRSPVVIVHGMGDSLESQIDDAERFRLRGHPVLLLDLRGHGGSEGKFCTLGAHERRDVLGAMHELHGRKLGDRGFVLVGRSLGAVTVLLVAAERSDVRAVIAEAPFDSYRETVSHHGRLYYHMPPWLPFGPLAIALSEWRAGFDADDVDAVAAARRSHQPLLAIVDGADERMPLPVVRRIVEAHAGPHELWVAPGAPHAGASGQPEYWRRVSAFLERYGI